MSFEVAKKAEDLSIQILCLPANTTHELQPLDKAYFGPFKREMDGEVGKWLQSNPGKGIQKGCVFEKIFTAAFQRSAKPSTITNSFLKCDMYPPDMDQIDHNAFAPAEASPRPQDQIDWADDDEFWDFVGDTRHEVTTGDTSSEISGR